MKQLKDTFGRVHNYLRISLTDNCNLRCMYCNPRGNAIANARKGELLSFEELRRLIKIFVERFGFKKIRFTGGEPLVRNGFENFLKSLESLKREHDLELCMTTNGTLLENKIENLRNYGLDRVNISLDSLNSEKFKLITGREGLESVANSINKAEELGYAPVKVNCVVIKGINDNEILDFVEFVKNRNVNVRFIEYMPFTNNGWDENSFISSDEIRNVIELKYRLIKIQSDKNKVTEDYYIDGFKGSVSFITPISNHFCEACNRIRLTADGSLRLCLFSEKNDEIDLKRYLRNENISDNDIANVINELVHNKSFKHPDIKELINLDYNYMLRAGG